MTGTSKRPLQIKWLEKYRIAYTVGHKGDINVLRKLVEQRHGVKSSEPDEVFVDMGAMHR
jgi:hypothetical protein